MARRLAKALRRSLLSDPTWTLAGDGVLTKGDWHVFDDGDATYKHHWLDLPILQRCFVRWAARYRINQEALANLG